MKVKKFFHTSCGKTMCLYPLPSPVAIPV